MILLLALSLWPMASFGASACCPDAASSVEQAAPVHAHHGMHGTASADVAGGNEAPTMPDCHDADAASPSHADCSSECAARCATPSLLMAPAMWPASMASPQHPAPWHASLAPRPQGTRLLRPPIHA